MEVGGDEAVDVAKVGLRLHIMQELFESSRNEGQARHDNLQGQIQQHFDTITSSIAQLQHAIQSNVTPGIRESNDSDSGPVPGSVRFGADLTIC